MFWNNYINYLNYVKMTKVVSPKSVYMVDIALAALFLLYISIQEGRSRLSAFRQELICQLVSRSRRELFFRRWQRKPYYTASDYRT